MINRTNSILIVDDDEHIRLLFADCLREKGFEVREAAAGSPATVRALLEAQIRESGVNYLMCRLAFGDLTLEQSLRSLGLLTTEVLPALAVRA